MAPPALWVYRALMFLLLPVAVPGFLFSAWRKGKKRPPIRQRLGFGLPALPSGAVFVHAVSVGEVGVARSLLAELRRRRPELPLILSATTSTGLSVAHSARVADVVLPFPVDLPGPLRRVIGVATPRLIVLVETELWPELLWTCARLSIPVALANARVSERSFRGYRLTLPLLRPLLRPVTVALAQSEQDAERRVGLGIARGRVRVTGNIKFDAVPAEAAPGVVGELRGVAGARPVLLAGSTMPGEDALVLDALVALPEEERPFLVLAPRHPERAAEVAALVAARGLAVARRTALAQAPPDCAVVVLDTIGELAALYQLADVAFIGGSLVPTGGHNPIEPARFGVPTLTGPHVKNFAAVYREFITAGAARVVHSADELAGAVRTWLSDRSAARAAGEAGRQLLARHAGATARTVDALERLLA
jgi:3-deoxy-D-manno-octulosonic-acid transferase